MVSVLRPGGGNAHGIGGNFSKAPSVQEMSPPVARQHSTGDSKPQLSQAQCIVSCGWCRRGQTIRIVHPDQHTLCCPSQIGEIWVSGDSVAHGYWRRPQITQEVFHARVADADDGPYLRTGDLGFMQAGELYVTGRLKDLIIIHGRNYYPQDIEFTVQQCHSALQPDAGAAFTIEIEGQNLLVIAQEVKRHARHMPDMDSLIKAIRQAVVAEYQLTVHRVVLLKPGGIPKTTSGKIQRSRCRELLIAEDLPVIRQYVLAYPVTTPLSPSGPAFSLLYFSSHEAEFSEDKYRLLIDGAKFADQHDFEAV